MEQHIALQNFIDACNKKIDKPDQIPLRALYQFNNFDTSALDEFGNMPGENFNCKGDFIYNTEMLNSSFSSYDEGFCILRREIRNNCVQRSGNLPDDKNFLYNIYQYPVRISSGLWMVILIRTDDPSFYDLHRMIAVAQADGKGCFGGGFKITLFQLGRLFHNNYSAIIAVCEPGKQLDYEKGYKKILQLKDVPIARQGNMLKLHVGASPDLKEICSVLSREDLVDIDDPGHDNRTMEIKNTLLHPGINMMIAVSIKEI